MRINRSSVNWNAIRAYRLMDRLHRSGSPLGEWAAWKVSRASKLLTGVDIVPGARIGPDFYIHHGQGIVIGHATIGRGVHLLHGVTLGKAANTGDSMTGEWPTIGDNVHIYAGATLVGGITVGDGAVIGANAFVRTDVPAGATFVAPQAVDVATLKEPADGILYQHGQKVGWAPHHP